SDSDVLGRSSPRRSFALPPIPEVLVRPILLRLSASFLALGLIAGCDDRPTSDAGAGGDGGVAGDGAVGGDAGMMVTPTSPLVDPDCVDGMFSETLPDPSADISDLVTSYSPADLIAFVDGVLARRYTTGAELALNGRMGSLDCVTVFSSNTGTADGAIDSLNTVVHECGHLYDGDESPFGSNTYVINDSPLRLTCAGGNSMGLGGMTFERSRIRNDSYQTLRPPCAGGGTGCDFYADVYLDGDPDDGTFDGGDQGFSMLLEETVQYVNSLATSYAFTNELNRGGRSSQKDGILTFLWYVMRYLRMARLEYPTAYEHILDGDGGCWRNAVLTVWGRAWLYLDVTESMTHLGIDDAALTTLVMDQDLLGEIQRLRDAEGCPAP
ncbi:MAG: hypothetical protein AB7P00_41845, partial [Sandaracinaceae bacterium]